MEIITATASAIAVWMLSGAFEKAGGELGTTLITQDLRNDPIVS